jgi:monoamine oxidase
MHCNFPSTAKENLPVANDNTASRRDFLKTLSLALGATLLRPLTAVAQVGPTQFFSRRKADNPKRILVIGAGLAGLTAAYELTQAGHEVIVFEARNRAGGRVLTVRDFADGLYAEAGGEGVEHNHDYMLRYLEEFGFSLYPESYANPAPLDALPRERTPQEALKEVVKQITPFQQFSHPEYDKISFAELLQQLAASSEMMEQMQRYVSALMAINIESISARAMLSEMALPATRATFRIAGGNDQVPKRLAYQLRERVHYARPVVKITHNADGVQVTILENGLQQTVNGQFLIIAAPLTCVRRIEIAPALSEQHMNAIATLAYGQVLKAPMQFRERFWLKQSGDLNKGLPGLISSVYESSKGQAGTRGLLTAYIPDKSGYEIASLPAEQRLDKVLGKVTEVHAEAQRQFEGGFVKWWQEDMWAQGTYAYFRPSDVMSLRPVLTKPEGRIHFAGEHTAGWQGYMNGAIESGHRAAQEVHTA